MNVKSGDVSRIRSNSMHVIEMLKTFLPKELPREYDIRDNKFVKMIERLRESDNILLYGLDRKDDWSDSK
jgi:hypothetical protein